MLITEKKDSKLYGDVFIVNKKHERGVFLVRLCFWWAHLKWALDDCMNEWLRFLIH